MINKKEKICQIIIYADWKNCMKILVLFGETHPTDDDSLEENVWYHVGINTLYQEKTLLKDQLQSFGTTIRQKQQAAEALERTLDEFNALAIAQTSPPAPGM